MADRYDSDHMSADCDDPGTVRCPRCGTENPAGNTFCGECGGRLDGDGPSARRPQVIYGDSPAHCLIYDSDEPLDSLGSLADLDRSKVILPEGAEWVGENKVRFADGRTRRFIDADRTLVLRYPAIALILLGIAVSLYAVFGAGIDLSLHVLDIELTDECTVYDIVGGGWESSATTISLTSWACIALVFVGILYPLVPVLGVTMLIVSVSSLDYVLMPSSFGTITMMACDPSEVFLCLVAADIIFFVSLLLWNMAQLGAKARGLPFSGRMRAFWLGKMG